ncbi:tetratricopeptide repeat protein [Hyphomicrobium nitrativorans]|nr:tetratricopeptide repeat protein [Hyphomicrobium nitrativorans]
MRSDRAARTRIIIHRDIARTVAEEPQYDVLYVRFWDPGQAGERELTAEELRVRAVQGDVEAQIGWGHKLLDGADVPRDLAAAYRWFRLAAGAGHADAFNMMGRCYELGWSVEPDAREAAEWYRKASDKGHAWGAFNLGCLLAQGRGVPVDPAAALTQLVRAARRGNASAMNMIGRYREQTREGARAARSAGLWYRWAAEGGCFRGQFHHGRSLAEAGQAEEGRTWIERALAGAPDDYRRDAVAVLRTHPLAVLRELAPGRDPDQLADH